MDLKKKILQEKIEETVQKNGCLLVDVIFRGSPNIPVIEIYIDNEKGVDIELCSVISRELSEIIDSEELLPANYRLDISSPGVEKSLKFLLQYKKHINRNLEIEYLEGEEKKKFNGKLKIINDDKLILNTANRNRNRF